MSSSENCSPAPVATVEALHQPAQAAQVQVPQAPLGNTTNLSHYKAFSGAMGQKALLAKKMAKTHHPSTISPTDNLMTPCTAKLTQAKKKHFNKAASVKPLSFGPSPTEDSEEEDEKPESA
ncbi:hypothetical protein FRB94_012598 [Tulasnella sp. JGI-2019a]|nr:hypothetical protein FRB93_008105 [Tulasnella sp. JGI-2019a]KAG8991325.1 hypothetical protein FRB94_012598 [Tulasnella sp. JGI-2019a]KAG9030709.1 hypothetical protein FRB95_003611 [Tulasnella sp. JGI-2019a]